MKPGLVSSDRLRLMKCPICGSRDKNASNIENDAGEPVMKILACNQCGHLTFFGVAAQVVTDILSETSSILCGVAKNARSVDEYTNIVRCQHAENHPE